MRTIFFAFANPEDKYLPALRKEEEALYQLMRDKGPSKYKLERLSNAGQRTLPERLIYLQLRDLEIFLISGHADRDKWLLEDGIGYADGIAKLLEPCDQLNLVFLNGCSTAGQIRLLRNLESKPAIIASTTSVGDNAARHFSVDFFNSFIGQQKTLQLSFNNAISSLNIKQRGIEITTWKELDDKEDGDASVCIF